MRKQRFKKYCLSAALVALFCALGSGAAFAASSSSAHYEVNDAQFDAGSQANDCSASYCSNISIGDTVVGQASSSSYKAQFGSDTDEIPLLEVITEGGTQNLGVIGTSTTATSTTTVKVRDYLSSGYAMELTGTPPGQGVHELDALTSPSTSQPGTEQFGINLVANTTPSIGSDPTQVPSSAYSFGTVDADYDTPNLFKYSPGDEIASSASSSGETDYTLSMIINVSNVTPGGHYSGSYSVVVVPVY